MIDFNLIVTTRRFAEEQAEEELFGLLESFGDTETSTEITHVTGLIECRTTLDPFKVVSLLAKEIQKEPWSIRYILRAVPVERVVSANSIDNIAESASELSLKKILEADTYRITVEKRHTKLKSHEIITAIASRISHKVDLNQPDWVVLVEIIGGEAGVSVLKPGEIFSSVIEKRR